MVSPLLEAAGSGRPLTPALKRGWALMCGMSLRTLERALAEGRTGAPEAPGGRRWLVPDQVLVRIAEHGGNVRAAWRDLRAEGRDVPSYPSLCRAIDARDANLKYVLRHGTAELNRFLLVGEMTVARRNQLWYTDATRVPIACRDGGRLVEQLTLVSYLDAYSRCVIAHCLVVGAEDAETAGRTLLAALLGRDYSVDEVEAMAASWGDDAAGRLRALVPEAPEGAAAPGRRPAALRVGGRPERLQSDNGGPFASAEYAEITRTFLHGAHGFGRPHTPADQGRQERFHRTLKESILALVPGYTRGQQTGPADDPRRRPISMPGFDLLPDLRAVRAAVDGAIWAYNTEHVVRTTGLTPLAAYLLDETPILPVDPLVVWPRMPVGGIRRVDPRGVHVDGRYWTSAALARHIGRAVEFRSLPGQPGRVFVADPDGGPPIEVEPNAALMRTEGGRAERLAANQSKGRFLRGLMRGAKEAKEEWAGEVADDAGELPAPPVPQSRTERARRTPRTSVDSGRALSRAFDPTVLAGGRR